MSPIRRYAVCGLSNRGLASFVPPILGLTDRTADGTADRGFGYGSDDDLSAYADVVAIVDADADRVAEFNQSLERLGRAPIPYFDVAQYDDMLAELTPDAVIVTSPDHTHESYILGALARDVDVITEKPMVTTAAAAAAVLAAERTSAGTVRVTHNLRYAAAHREVKRLIQAGTIGRITRVVMDYHVDLRHGASYFLRWNRRRELSGGLQVHKSSHHFDLLNWWIGEAPEEIFGYGSLNYYGPDGPHRPAGELPVAEQRAKDPYYLAQQGSGTFPDDDARTGLFGLHYSNQYPRPLYIYDDEIDIEDTYCAVVRYPGGAALTYSIDFSSTWEGFRLSIAGTHGSIDLLHGRTVDGTALPESDRITVAELFGPTRVIEVHAEVGGHGGADPLMRRDLFTTPTAESTALGLMATSTEAAYAVTMGDALIRSFTTHHPINLPALLAQPSS
ncbi:Gfo/Idh/MocA family protein [Kribbella solani]|uniref:Gfo/Idh/MocA family protein n=1 Tax=Kribbella solani TaxID=236067 RepID=UPI0029B2474D|nr:Gfo/Idh/MocA family oxidoreductase [Kribbella solani]MDX2974313.1 Gfo/Idh/MocA family oxidoreductase [Kribbella solani]